MAIALRNLGYTFFKAGDNANAVLKLSNYLDHVPEDFDILYLVSRLYFDLAQYADALRYVERCVMLQPQSAELLVLLADCYLKLGHIESARLGYTQALAIDPANDKVKAQLRQIEAMRAEERQLAGSRR
jgi:Flp pilus assembly protein TadD